MSKILFVYDMPLDKEPFWKDGLWAAIKELEKEHDVWWENLQVENSMYIEGGWDFVLGWGAFNSPVDRELRKPIYRNNKKGLCLAGNSYPPVGADNYDIIFYETEWAKNWLLTHPDFNGRQLIHAFGVNTDIYHQTYNPEPLFDCVSVGSFSLWKRQNLILNRPGGFKMVIGEIQKGNLTESIDIIGELLLGGVSVSDMIVPERLADVYRNTIEVYIPANLNGGGERAVLEARACGASVAVEYDNPKLSELMECPIWDHRYYANQLKKGIEECLKDVNIKG